MENQNAIAKATTYDRVASPQALEQYAKALPEMVKAELFARVAQTAMLKNPKLKECSLQSLSESLLNCAAIGLLPNGEHAALVPYGKTAKLVVMYQGFIQLVHRTERVKDIGAEIVRKNDAFEFMNGKVKRHEFDPFASDEDRGPVVGCWAWSELVNGGVHHEVMSYAELEAIKAGSPGARRADSPWNHPTYILEMYKKTVFRRLKKWIPSSPDFQHAVQIDSDGYERPVKGSSSSPYDAADWGDGLSPEQVEELKAALVESGKSESGLLEWLEVDSLQSISKGQFPQALSACKEAGE